MKKVSLIIVSLLLFACAKEPNVAVRIDCGENNDKGFQATINGKPVGDCPIDVLVHAGEITVSVRKDNEDASYLYGEAKMMLAEDAMKRIKLDIQPVYTEEYYFRNATDVGGINNYLKHQPNGKRKPSLEAKLEKIYFDGAKDIDGMNAYIGLYPNGTYVKEIREHLESTLAEIERKKNEVIALEKQRKEQSELKRKEAQQKRFLSLGFSDNEDGTVTQVENGIIWSRCQYPKIMKGYSCSGEDNTYVSKYFREIAEDWSVSKVINIDYMNRKDWRVMTKEGYDILCSGNNRELLKEIFPDFSIEKCWEFSPRKGSVFFSKTSPMYLQSSYQNTDAGYYIMLVRFPVSLPSLYVKKVNDRFSKLKVIDNGNGTVTDQSTGLMWSRCATGQKFNLITCEGMAKKYNFDKAMLAAKKSNLAGFADWRVPSSEEIKSILQCSSGFRADGYCNNNSTAPFFDAYLFPNLYRNGGMWTNKKFQKTCYMHGSYTCAEQFYLGSPGESNVVNDMTVLLVRSGK